MTDLLLLDTHLFQAIKATAAAPPALLWLAIAIAKVPIYLIPAGMVILWLRNTPRDRELALRTFSALVLAIACSFLIGEIWMRPRPFLDGLGPALMPHRDSPSFPSNHASIMTASALCLWYAGRRTAALAWGLVTLLVSLARIYLGVHYPLDIVTGWLLGAATATISWRLPRRS
ncbi:MAG: undecaprenyl-diphosphatase [Corticimicrobacter sp.]|uniref:undecaprenyl-diphosphatase n=1 Tax=Corticimicrobacter sp. TaxID=2678536 RepID=UPI0032DBDA20